MHRHFKLFVVCVVIFLVAGVADLVSSMYALSTREVWVTRSYDSGVGKVESGYLVLVAGVERNPYPCPLLVSVLFSGVAAVVCFWGTAPSRCRVAIVCGLMVFSFVPFVNNICVVCGVT